MTGGTGKIAVLALAAAILLLGVSAAGAELTERGNLFVKFDGGIAPETLPRFTRAPISVSVAGTVRTLSGERPPALRQIEIAINRGGTIDTRGLAVCRRSQLVATSSVQARRNCSKALVGGGHYVGVVAFPEQGSFPSSGRILAFNAVVDGKRAILAHVYGGHPIPVTRIIVFSIHHSAGTFGTVLTGELPPSLNRYGYVRQIALNLHRTFAFHGRRRSYLGAACGAPAGVRGALFPFARVSMTFADGRRLASTLIRSCKVRH